MSIAFYFDEHVPRPIAKGLRDRGIDVLTVQEDGHDGDDDPVLLDRCNTLERVLFTRDDDFLAEAAHRQTQGIPFAGIVYAHPVRVNGRKCIDDLEIIAGACDRDELANRVQFLPL